MNAKDLASVWSAPDNSRLTSKQSSYRLPVHVAAKLAALSEMYPQKTKTQIVGDLLAAALADLEKGLPSSAGRLVGKDDEGADLFEAVGPAQDFRRLTNKHYAELEAELGNASAPAFFERDLWVDKDGA
jgi:hypothetical protein